MRFDFKYLKTLLIFFIIFMPALLSASGNQNIRLSFFYKNNKSRIRTIDPDRRSINLENGDKLKIFYQPLDNTYFYIYHVDADERVALFFPADFAFRPQDKATYFIPKGGPDDPVKNWLTLDGKGPDHFYLIASPVRLTNLETLTDNYRNSNDPVEKKKLLDQLANLFSIAEEVDNETSLFQKKEKTTKVISGTLKNFKFKVNTISVREIYVRKITIIH